MILSALSRGSRRNVSEAGLTRSANDTLPRAGEGPSRRHWAEPMKIPLRSLPPLGFERHDRARAQVAPDLQLPSVASLFADVEATQLAIALGGVKWPPRIRTEGEAGETEPPCEPLRGERT